MSGAPCWSVRASRWSAATAGSTRARTREAKTPSGSRDGRADRGLTPFQPGSDPRLRAPKVAPMAVAVTPGVRPRVSPGSDPGGNVPKSARFQPVRGQTPDRPRGGRFGASPPGLPRLEQLEFVADGNFAVLDDAGQHAALAVQLGAKAVPQLVHPVARIADHRDLEDRVLADAHALADQPLLHVHAFDGHVLADRARLDVDRPQVVRRGEQHLASGRVRVRAALEALAGDRAPPLVPDGAAALALGRRPDAGDRGHARSLAPRPT